MTEIYKKVNRQFLGEGHSLAAASYYVEAYDSTEFVGGADDDPAEMYGYFAITDASGDGNITFRGPDELIKLRDLMNEAIGHYENAKVVIAEHNAAFRTKKAAEAQTAEFV